MSERIQRACLGKTHPAKMGRQKRTYVQRFSGGKSRKIRPGAKGRFPTAVGSAFRGWPTVLNSQSRNQSLSLLANHCRFQHFEAPGHVTRVLAKQCLTIPALDLA